MQRRKHVQEDLPNKHIYVELDSLLDTRFATLSLIDPALTTRVMDSNYMTRTKDSFEHITPEVFEAFYSARDKSLLPLTKLTSLVPLLSDLIYKARMTDITLDGDGVIYLFVNVFPYKLDKVEIEAITKALLPYMTDVEDIVIIDQENISPKWLDENVSMAFMYDAMEWIKYNSATEALVKSQFFRGDLFAPKIINSDDEVEEEDFEGYAKLMMPISNIKFLETNTFSIDI